MTPLLSQVARLGPGLATVAALAVDVLIWGGNTASRGGIEISAAALTVALVILYAPLAIGARFPVAAFASVWVASLIPILIPSFEPLAGLSVALFLVARFSAERVAFLAWLAALVPTAVTAWNNANMNELATLPEGEMRNFWAFLLTWVIIRAIPTVFGSVLHRYANRIVDHQAALARAAESARVAERARITQELHDIVAHSLSAMVLQAAGAKAVNDRTPGGNERVGQALTAIEDSGGQAMRELHRLLGLLRGSRSPQQDHQEPLARKLDEIDELAETARSAGLNVSLRTTGTPRPLDPSVEHSAYRLLQEGLTNAMKYAGVGARVVIDQAWSSRQLDISVRSYDGGKKPALASGGHGLVNLSERIHLVGGNFESMPMPDGFLLKAQFPV